MQDVAKLNNVVVKLSKMDSVVNVYASSRAGVFALGAAPKMTDRAMISAITSMMLGAAEQIGREMGDELNHVTLHLNDSCMVILGVGNKHLIGMVLDRSADPDKVAKEAISIIAQA
ncbi:MAG: hypothetical protein A4E32_02048 [Methanomassiliicoccales archaeon PtaU1.Bin124]|nr:MAG: hypothetical protein A4E32_02048 [Methanomassiliicoccales archaeon PtaU1.Bin124]